jgi:hypothetical protein
MLCGERLYLQRWTRRSDEKPSQTSQPTPGFLTEWMLTERRRNRRSTLQRVWKGDSLDSRVYQLLTPPETTLHEAPRVTVLHSVARYTAGFGERTSLRVVFWASWERWSVINSTRWSNLWRTLPMTCCMVNCWRMLRFNRPIEVASEKCATCCSWQSHRL